MLTAFSLANILHTFGCAFDIDITARRSKVSNYNACSSELGHELE